MSEHAGTVFNHSCLKIPINPVNKLPSPSYEQKHINHLKNQVVKLNSDAAAMKSKQSTTKKESLKSFIDFYDSIPDYSDINHLSNQEFYQKIENLKAKQKSFYEYLDVEYNIENKIDNFIDDYKKQASGEQSYSKKSTKFWNNYASPEPDLLLSDSKEVPIPPPSRRSVRIESPKSEIESKYSDQDLNSKAKTRRNILSADSKASSKSVYSAVDQLWDDDFELKNDLHKTDDIRLKLDCHTPLATRSLPSSPIKNKQNVGWKDCGITIPKPFQMTVRDEEEKILNDIMSKNTKIKPDKPEMFRAHAVPVESRVPLFERIMEEQEIRRHIVKERSKEALRSKMRPFSFTRREEELSSLTGKFSKSTPQLCPQLSSAYYEPELKIKPFRAKPVPKNLFSNYIYEKMHEDEFYRALKKKIRAEELLKASSLPPSMAAREKTHKRHSICPKILRELESDREHEEEKKKSVSRSSNYSSKQEQLDLELDDLKNDFITTTPRPFKFQTANRWEKKRSRSAKKCHRASEYENVNEKRAQSALELQSVNRSNLAAVLRIQSARKRMETEMCRRLEEQKLKEEVRWRERVMRQKPVWQALSFSHEEDLEMRLQLRRDEEKLREDEHRHHMELMHGRVQQMPTLFERQSHFKAPKTKRELIETLYDEINYSSSCLNEIDQMKASHECNETQMSDDKSTEKDKFDYIDED